MEYHFPIPGSVDEKKIVLFLRKHWASNIGLFSLSAFLFLFPIILFLAAFFTDRNIFHGLLVNLAVLGFSTYYLVISTFIFTAWLTYYYDVYIITDQVVVDIIQQGFLGRKIIQLSLLRIQDVTSEIKGLLPTIFAYGNVLIETAGEQTQNLALEDIPNPQEVASRIMQLHNDAIDTEGRHHQILEAEGALAPGIIKPEEEPRRLETPYEESLKKAVEEENGLVVEKPPVKPVANVNKPIHNGVMSEAHNEDKVAVTSHARDKEGEIEHSDLDKGREIDF